MVTDVFGKIHCSFMGCQEYLESAPPFTHLAVTKALKTCACTLSSSTRRGELHSIHATALTPCSLDQLAGQQAVGHSAGALKDEGVVLPVGAKQAVPPGEVEGAVVARVDVVQEVRLGGGGKGGEADACGDRGVQPQRGLIAAVAQDVGAHLQAHDAVMRLPHTYVTFVPTCKHPASERHQVCRRRQTCDLHGARHASLSVLPRKLIAEVAAYWARPSGLCGQEVHPGKPVRVPSREEQEVPQR